MFARYKYHILLHLIIFIWGFTGILGKLIGLEAVYIVWHRLWIAFLFLGIYLFIKKKSFHIPDRIQLFKIFGVGALVLLHWLTFYYSIQMSTASLGILCLSTTTLHVTWLEPLVMKRKFSWLEMCFGLIVIYGIYFVSGNFNAQETKALIVGLISALFAAMFSVFNAKLVQTTPSYKITFYEMLSGFVLLNIFLLFSGKFKSEMFMMTTWDFLWLLFLGIICTSFAFLATIDVVKKLGAFTVSLSINLEPVYTIILAIIILKENKVLGSRFYLGALVIVLIVIANAVVKYIQKKNNKKNLINELD